MYRAVPIIISKKTHAAQFAFCDDNARKAKLLYNAALFRIRQIFTGWDKPIKPAATAEVFTELDALKKAYPGITVRRVLSYNTLEKLMRVTRNPDFFSGLPMQTAQAVVKSAVRDFRNWLNALKDYKASPGKYLGRPRMPGYKKTDAVTFSLTNQDAVFYPAYGKDGSAAGASLKLPLMKERLFLAGFSPDTVLKEVNIKPYYGKYIITLIIQDMAPPFYPDMPNMAGVDLGVDNIAAVVTTDSSSRVYKGGAVLSENRFFHKEKGHAVSCITKGHEHKRAHSRHIDRLCLKHDCFTKDQMHKISASIISYCVSHRAGVIVLGTNPGWKQKASIGKVNNQNFVSIPHAQLRWMITYKAWQAGILVIEQEESYTSKADCSNRDELPVYGESAPKQRFSGRRIERGLYRCHDGFCVNADCNGAANILRKAIPSAWDRTNDFHFLAYPESIGFRALNRRRTA